MKDVNLVEKIFDSNHRFESAIICTYGLNLNFFENYLMKFDALYSCENICIFTDSGTYNGFLTESYSPKWLNKKYLVSGLKSGGVFHPKLYLLASEKKAVIAIGSANLTRDGIASNLELLSFFEISEKDPSFIPLLREAVDYARKLALITKSQTAAEQIEMFSQVCQPYLYAEETSPGLRFIHNLDQPLMETIVESLGELKISKIQVLSPFYDSKLTPLEVLESLFPESEVEIFLQQKRSNFPKEYFSNINSNASVFLYQNLERYLHGKAILFHTDESVLLFTGSANFTISALYEIPPSGNYEIGLIGPISKEAADGLLRPAGAQASKLTKDQNIEIRAESEFQPRSGLIDYITEAVLENDIISVSVNNEISPAEFAPVKLRLLDFNDNIYEENLDSNLSVKLSPQIKKKVPGKIAVQILGRGNGGKELESNISWVIELEKKGDAAPRRKLQRIFNNPFELKSVLHELLLSGSEEDLRLFIFNFDAPLDLIFPPQSQRSFASINSKGNIEGMIPFHHRYKLSADFKDAYTSCLNRLYRKLESHREDPQITKIGNFVMILSLLFSLIDFINNELIYDKYKNARDVDTATWGSIRDFYQTLIKYVDCSLDLIYAKRGYGERINDKIKKNQAHEEDSPASFEEYGAQYYSDSFDEISACARRAVTNFQELHQQLLLKTPTGKKIRRGVFNDTYLQPAVLDKMTEKINRLFGNG